MIRVYIRDAFPGDQLEISILNVGDQPGDDRYIMHQRIEGEDDRQFLATEWKRVEETYSPGTPTFRLPYGVGEALVRALTTHFQGGVDDLAMLRKDYTDERGRVDKLLEVLSDIARSSANGRADV